MASLGNQVERIVAATIAVGQTPGAVVLVGRGHSEPPEINYETMVHFIERGRKLGR